MCGQDVQSRATRPTRFLAADFFDSCDTVEYFGGEVGQAGPHLSDGRQIEVHPDDLKGLQKRDPDLKIDEQE